MKKYLNLKMLTSLSVLNIAVICLHGSTASASGLAAMFEAYGHTPTAAAELARPRSSGAPIDSTVIAVRVANVQALDAAGLTEHFRAFNATAAKPLTAAEMLVISKTSLPVVTGFEEAAQNANTIIQDQTIAHANVAAQVAALTGRTAPDPAIVAEVVAAVAAATPVAAPAIDPAIAGVQTLGLDENNAQNLAGYRDIMAAIDPATGNPYIAEDRRAAAIVSWVGFAGHADEIGLRQLLVWDLNTITDIAAWRAYITGRVLPANILRNDITQHTALNGRQNSRAAKAQLVLAALNR